jgi:hypothetical protein
MKFTLVALLVFLLCHPALCEEQVLRKFSLGEITSRFSGKTKSQVDTVTILNNPTMITKGQFGFKGTVDIDKVPLGGLEMRVVFKSGETYATMTQPVGYKYMQGSAKNQPFFITFKTSMTGEPPGTIERVILGATMPEGGSLTVKSLELVQW